MMKVVTYALLLLLVELSGDAQDSVGQPRVRNSLADVFVSSSQGDDRNPATRRRPVRTILRAMELAQNAPNPTHVLLKRGDVWMGRDGWFRNALWKSGISESEPFQFKSYGEGARPQIENCSWYFRDNKDRTIQFITVRDIDFYRSGRDPQSVHFGEWAVPKGGAAIEMLGGVSGLRIENCRFRWHNKGITIKRFKHVPSGIVIHRNVIQDSYSPTAHSQGIYTNRVHDLTITENIVVHNGWLDHEHHQLFAGDRRVAPTKFNHGMYLHSTKGARIRGNIIADSSSFGIKFSGGTPDAHLDVLCDDNILYRNGNTVTLNESSRRKTVRGQFTHRRFRIVGNIFERTGRDNYARTGPHSWGVHLAQLSESEISRNYFLNKDPIGGSFGIKFRDKADTWHENNRVADNIFYGWQIKHETDYVVIAGNCANCVAENNEVDAAGYVDPSRSFQTYLEAHGITVRDLCEQESGNWRYTAGDAIAWIRQGFMRPGKSGVTEPRANQLPIKSPSR